MLLRAWILLVIIFSGCAQPTLDNSPYVAHKVSDSAFILVSKSNGTNFGAVATPKGTLLIDPTPEISQIKRLHVTVQELFLRPVTLIASTHTHATPGDGLRYFAEWGAVELTQISAIPNIIILPLNAGSLEDKVIYIRDSNVMFVGNLLEYIPTEATSEVEDSQKKLIGTLLKIGDDKSVIVPSHGPLTSLASIRKRFGTSLAEKVSSSVFAKSR